MTKYSNIKFIYDATGGRFHHFQKRVPAPIIELGKTSIILQDDKYYQPHYNPRLIHKLENITSHYVGGTSDRVISFIDSSGEQYSFFGAYRRDPSGISDPSGRGFIIKPEIMSETLMNKKETWEFITGGEKPWWFNIVPRTNWPKQLNKKLKTEGTELLIGDEFKVSVYETGTKFSKYNPVEIFNHNNNEFLLFLIGDSLAMVNAKEGKNIDLSRRVITEKIVPLVQDIQNIM
jgi:hypothetical protein